MPRPQHEQDEEEGGIEVSATGEAIATSNSPLHQQAQHQQQDASASTSSGVGAVIDDEYYEYVEGQDDGSSSELSGRSEGSDSSSDDESLPSQVDIVDSPNKSTGSRSRGSGSGSGGKIRRRPPSLGKYYSAAAMRRRSRRSTTRFGARQISSVVSKASRRSPGSFSIMCGLRHRNSSAFYIQWISDDVDDESYYNDMFFLKRWYLLYFHSFYKKNEVFILVIIAILLARAYPPIGAIYLYPQITSTWIAVILIFILVGMGLRTEKFSQAFQRLTFNTWVQFFSFGIVSGTVYSITRLLLDVGIVNNIGLANGMVICSCLPMTISSVTVLTKLSGGDDASAIFNSAFSSFLAVALTPILTVLYLGTSIGGAGGGDTGGDSGDYIDDSIEFLNGSNSTGLDPPLMGLDDDEEGNTFQQELIELTIPPTLLDNSTDSMNGLNNTFISNDYTGITGDNGFSDSENGVAGGSNRDDYLDVFLKLVFRVLVPVLFGQLLQKTSLWFMEFVEHHKMFFTKLQSYLVIFIVYCVFCTTFNVDSNIKIVDIFTMIGIQFVFLCGLMMISWKSLTLLFPNQPKLHVMGLLGTTQKSLAMGVPLINAIYESDPSVGLYTLPLLVWYPLQLVLGSFVSPNLKEYAIRERWRIRIEQDRKDAQMKKSHNEYDMNGTCDGARNIDNDKHYLDENDDSTISTADGMFDDDDDSDDLEPVCIQLNDTNPLLEDTSRSDGRRHNGDGDGGQLSEDDEEAMVGSSGHGKRLYYMPSARSLFLMPDDDDPEEIAINEYLRRIAFDNDYYDDSDNLNEFITFHTPESTVSFGSVRKSISRGTKRMLSWFNPSPEQLTGGSFDYDEGCDDDKEKHLVSKEDINEAKKDQMLLDLWRNPSEEMLGGVADGIQNNNYMDYKEQQIRFSDNVEVKMLEQAEQVATVIAADTSTSRVSAVSKPRPPLENDENEENSYTAKSHRESTTRSPATLLGSKLVVASFEEEKQADTTLSSTADSNSDTFSIDISISADDSASRSTSNHSSHSTNRQMLWSDPAKAFLGSSSFIEEEGSVVQNEYRRNHDTQENAPLVINPAVERYPPPPPPPQAQSQPQSITPEHTAALLSKKPQPASPPSSPPQRLTPRKQSTATATPILSETSTIVAAQIKNDDNKDMERSRSTDGDDSSSSDESSRSKLWGDPEELFLQNSYSEASSLRIRATAVTMAGTLIEELLDYRPSYTEYDSPLDGSVGSRSQNSGNSGSAGIPQQLWGDPEQVLLKRGSAMSIRNQTNSSLSKVEEQQEYVTKQQSPTRNRLTSFTRKTGEHSITDPQAAVNYIIDKEKRKEKLQLRHKKRLEQESDGSRRGHKRHHKKK